jgi:hypothetical protein
MKIPKHRTIPYPQHWNKILQTKWYSYKVRATDKNKDFSLSDDLFEYLFTQKCSYCGETKDITIDRIDSNIGYITNNVQPVCNLCNRMKLTQSEKEFKTKLLQIISYRDWKQ